MGEAQENSKNDNTGTPSERRLRRLQELLASGEYVCYKKNDKNKSAIPKELVSKLNVSTSGTLVTDASQSQRQIVLTNGELENSPTKKKGQKFAHLMHLAFVLSLTNIISFPSYCGKYGGGVFLIPLVLCYLFVGVPLLYVEMALGQFSSVSPVEIFRRFSPALSGLAVSVIAIDFYQNLYNSGYITGSTFLASKALEGMVYPVPWNACNNTLNSRFCYDKRLADDCKSLNITNAACETFWNTSREISESGWKMWIPPHMDFVTGTIFKTSFKVSELELPFLLCVFILATLWVLITIFSIIGLRRIGNGFVYLKIVSVLIVFISAAFSIATEQKGGGGLQFMFIPHDYSYLLKPDIWSNAVSCIVISLNLGTGTIHRISAYSDFNENFLMDAIIVCVCDLLFSIAVGTSLYTCMGSITATIYGEADSHLRIHQMYRQSTTMLWSMFPEQVTYVLGDTIYSNFFIAVHYFNFLFLGIPGMVVNVTLIRNALTDIAMAWSDAANTEMEFRRKIYTVIIALFSFTLSIILVQSTGLNLSHLWYQATCGALMATCLIELIAIVYGYGFRRFLANIESMLIGQKSELKHSIPLLVPCFYLITPTVLLVGFICVKVVALLFFETTQPASRTQ